MITEQVLVAFYWVLVRDQREVAKRQEWQAHEHVVGDLESEDKFLILGPQEQGFRAEVTADNRTQGTLSNEYSHEHLEIVPDRVIDKKQK